MIDVGLRNGDEAETSRSGLREGESRNGRRGGLKPSVLKAGDGIGFDYLRFGGDGKREE